MISAWLLLLCFLPFPLLSLLRTMLQLLKWSTDVGLLISAAMTAKLTARNLGGQLAHIVFQSRQSCIREAMAMRAIPAGVQNHMLYYLENSYITYNRITMSASVLASIPTTLKSTKSTLATFW